MKEIYNKNGYLKIEKENNLYFLEGIDGFEIYKWVCKSDDEITEVLFNALITVGVEEIIYNLYDSTFKEKLVDYMIEILKDSKNLSDQYVNVLIESIQELQL